MFDRLPDITLDPLVAIGGMIRADPRPDKIDLGVGMYRDADGQLSIMPAVKAAERIIVEEQASKSYLAADGDPAFAELLLGAILGTDPAVHRDGRMVLAQAAGGTGALRLGLELIARAKPGARAWLGTPSWPNHAPLLAATGIAVETYRHYDAASRSLDFDATMAAMKRAAPGDVVVLHGCCHNPSGCDFSADEWSIVADMLADRGLMPLIDLAYAGMGQGIEADTAGVRRVIDTVPQALVAISCSKSFGLYRERTGMLAVIAASTGDAARLRPNLQSLARLLWSNPPGHGAAIVATILRDADMTARWRAEIETMGARLRGLRQRLATAPIARFDPRFIEGQRGLFALLPLQVSEIERLQRDFGVYMPPDGRINIAGLNDGNFDAFVRALASLDGEPAS